VDLRGIGAVVVILSLAFGVGVKVGWDWRAGNFQAAMERAVRKATDEAAAKIRALESDLEVARATAVAAETKAAMQDAAASESALIIAKQSDATCPLTEARIDTLNAVMREAGR